MIAIIPARSGSKGLPNKNILMLINKPLIAYTIEAAIKSKQFDRVIVSTDSLEYRYISEKFGAEVIMRNASLSSDTASSYEVIQDVLDKCNHKTGSFTLLQPTSPFRDSEHIIKANLHFNNTNSEFLVSVSEAPKTPDLIKPIESDLSLKYFTADFANYRRQSSKEYSPNGAIFIGKTQAYLNKKHFFGATSTAYIMSKTDSIDIDDKLDFELAISIANSKNKKKALLKRIKARIQSKKSNFNQKKAITLIGHSIFDFWGIDQIKNQQINNLGIAGISTEQYYDLIVKPRLISKIGDLAIIISGTNDIVIENFTPEKTLIRIKQIAEYLTEINPNIKIIILSTPPVQGRIDRSNKIINEFNSFLESNIPPQCNFFKLSKLFFDDFGNLKNELTTDGLHFSDHGYKQLEYELSLCLN